jgi:Subtilase family
MPREYKWKLWALVCSAGCIAHVSAGLLDTVGVTPIRNEDSSLTGSGVRAAQPEAGNPTWEVNPAAIGQPTNLFTWISSSGSSTTYPNALGQESSHADAVGNNFYGSASGVAPGLASLDNYEANYFVLTLIPSLTAIRAQVVNQSFVGGISLPIGPGSESQYDNYVATYNTTIVSGVGNGGPPQLPATAFNLIAVGAYGGASSIGPTTNGGRAKPDITAPASATSFSTPLVAGAAVLLLQSAARDDAGAGTASSATNAITLKALLLNGAVKPSDWTNGPTSPLDARYGAGVLNAYNAWLQLRGGKNPFIESSSPSVGGDHFPESNTNTIAESRGWDYNAVSSSAINDGVNHYYFTLDAAQATRFSLTATLVWNRQAGQSGINNLDLFLYDTAGSNPITSCQSAVDNVQHIFLPSLPAGRYDLQVLKHGGVGIVSLAETYALAFDFEPVKLAISTSGTNVLVSWPTSPSGFSLQANSNITLTNGWSPVAATAVQTNGQYVVQSPLADGPQFFRLMRP